MKVIFLDIDGVLNTSETFRRRRINYEKTKKWDLEIDLHRVARLKYIINMTGAKVVLSSSWRLFGDFKNGEFITKSNQLKQLLEIFSSFGISIYDVTPHIDYGSNREEEIKKWLMGKDIESFVIIDDETSFLMEFCNKELVKTSFLKDGVMLENMDDCAGLCDEHVNKAIAILNSNQDEYKERVLKYTKGSYK